MHSVLTKQVHELKRHAERNALCAMRWKKFIAEGMKRQFKKKQKE